MAAQKIFCWCLTLGIFVGPIQTAAAQSSIGSPDQENIFWQTTESHPVELGRQFGSLYESLLHLQKKGYQLRTTKTLFKNGDTPEDVLRRNGLFYGEYFPKSVDKFLCNLNQTACEIRGSNIHWKIEINEDITIPDIQFEKVVQIRAIKKAEGTTLESIVVNTFHGCDSFDQHCRRQVANINFDKKNVLTPGFEGWIQVPTRSFRAKIPIELSLAPPTSLWIQNLQQLNLLTKNRATLVDSSTKWSNLADYSETLGSRLGPEEKLSFLRLRRSPVQPQSSAIVERTPSEVETAGHSWMVDLQDQALAVQAEAEVGQSSSWIAAVTSDAEPSRDEIISLLPGNAHLLPKRGLHRQITEWHLESAAAAIAGPTGDRTTVLQLINHPFGFNKPLGKMYSATVGIIDAWVFPKHCLFDQLHVQILNSVAPDPTLLAVTSGPCGEVADANPIRDHATHLVGLIAARQDAPTGPGINPTAYVDTYQVDPESFMDAEYVSGVISKLTNILLEEKGAPRIFNLSFSYAFVIDPTQPNKAIDQIEQFITNSNRNRIFVVAASEKLGGAVPRPRSCTPRPVCLDSPNVLTVAATDLTSRPGCPQLIQDSNHGPGIDLAAPGFRIVSAIANNKTGLLSGSSQAAPLVTGALSLLLGKSDQLEPLIAKNRLIYTADQCDSLDVFGGRLNIGRALAFEQESLLLSGQPALNGSILQANAAVHFTDVITHEQVSAKWKSIKRLYLQTGGYYLLLYHEKSPDDESSPLRRRIVSIDKMDAPLGFTVGAAQSRRRVNLKLGDIADYIGAINVLASPSS